MSDVIIGIRISGFGPSLNALVDNRHRFVTSVPTGYAGSPGLYEPVLIGYPESVQTEIDIRTGTATIGGMDFALTATDANVKRFMSAPAAFGFLAAAVSSTDVLWSVLDPDGNPLSGLEGVSAVSEREAITFVSETVAGTYTVARGQFQTVPQSHEVGRGKDTALFYADEGPALIGREVVFFRMPADGDASTEEEVWRGAIRDVVSPNPAVIQVACDDILSIVGRKKLFIDRFKAPYTLAGQGAEGVGGSQVVIDRTESTGDWVADQDDEALISIGGKTVVRNRTFRTIPQRPLSIRIDTPTVGGAEPISDVANSTPNGEAWEVWSTNPQLQPSINGEQLSENPVLLLLQLLTTTVQGDNGSYDLGDVSRPEIGRNLGVGIQETSVDVSAIEAVAAALTTAQYYPNLWLGLEGKPVNAKMLFQALLRPIACVLTGNGRGRLTVAKLGDTPELEAVSIVRRNCFESPIVQGRRLSEPFERIRAIYGEIPGTGTVEENFVDVIEYNRQDGAGGGAEEINVRGLQSREEVQNLISQLVAVFHDIPTIVKLATVRTVDLPIGETHFLTHASIFNPSTGRRGVVAVGVFVEAKEFPLKAGRITYKFRLSVGRRGRIAPSAKAVSSLTNVVTIESAAFTKPGGPFIADAQGFAVGDKVRFRASDFSDIAGVYTITAIPNFTTIELDGSPGVGAGDILESVDYDEPPSGDQIAKWVYIGDSVTKAIDGQAPYEWSV